MARQDNPNRDDPRGGGRRRRQNGGRGRRDRPGAPQDFGPQGPGQGQFGVGFGGYGGQGHGGYGRPPAPGDYSQIGTNQGYHGDRADYGHGDYWRGDYQRGDYGQGQLSGGFGPGFYGGNWGDQNWAQIENLTDDGMRDWIYSRIDDDTSIPADADIRVDVQDGEATITGSVRNRRIKLTVNEHAWNCPGIEDVQNNLRVNSRRREHRRRDQENSG